MKKIIYLITITSIFIFGCKKSTKSNDLNKGYSINKIEKTTVLKNSFVPDVKINNLELVNPNSILKSIGDLKEFVREEEGLPYAIFTNETKDTKLVLTLFPGSSINDVYQFKIEHVMEELKNVKVLPIKTFISENGIRLGMSKEELIKIKGNTYLVKDNYLEYRVSGNKEFLNKYNMPSYFARYFFSKDKNINKIEFGFKYP